MSDYLERELLKVFHYELGFSNLIVYLKLNNPDILENLLKESPSSWKENIQKALELENIKKSKIKEKHK